MNNEGIFYTTAPARAGRFEFRYYSGNDLRAKSRPLLVRSLEKSFKCPYRFSRTTRNRSASQTRVKHVVVLVQENHSFDSYFGMYCKGRSGSNPTCTTGPKCCESVSSVDAASGVARTVLNDDQNLAFNPAHSLVCESAEMNNRRMDLFVHGVQNCSNEMNLASADGLTAKLHWELARRYAMSDRYFQSASGVNCENDMYLARLVL